ncbi:MAG: hypothetical protein A3G81_20460 [Betaproteobacteria bacterium RIFCSPLOWO2_12_FULL_65_14]|nr:MAG: hypothetical protein A3G81_20460 [Betaproteobacteria bacterium RIFCSPLOWO2_12_FULL_65_14]
MDEEALIRRWIETWERAGPELEAIRRRELAQMTDAEARAAAADLLSMPLAQDLPERRSSGLVEQQRWFMRLHPA